jgi:hypothetical protein
VRHHATCSCVCCTHRVALEVAIDLLAVPTITPLRARHYSSSALITNLVKLGSYSMCNRFGLQQT